VLHLHRRVSLLDRPGGGPLDEPDLRLPCAQAGGRWPSGRTARHGIPERKRAASPRKRLLNDGTLSPVMPLRPPPTCSASGCR
jgi:hypothetical protein